MAAPLGTRRAAAALGARIAIVGTLALLATGCATAGSRGMMTRQAGSEAVAPATAAATAPGGPPSAAQGIRQLIRRGSMTVEVDAPSAKAREVEAYVAGVGGYVQHSTVGSDGRRARFALRVPAGSLDAVMDRVGTLGDVTRRGLSAQDVTEQVVDLDARRGALAAMRDRVQELLRRAESMRDIMDLERELARIQGELDSLDRRLATLRGQVALAELDVTLEREVVLGPVALLVTGIGRVVSKLFIWS